MFHVNLTSPTTPSLHLLFIPLYLNNNSNCTDVSFCDLCMTHNDIAPVVTFCLVIVFRMRLTIKCIYFILH